jgi:anti-anti-sigma factor
MTSSVDVVTAGTPAAVSTSWVRSQEGHSAVLTVRGDLDSASAGAVALALAAVGADSSDVIVDAARVESIDLSGLDALISAHRLFQILGLSLTLRAPSGPVRHLLDVYQHEDIINPGGLLESTVPR